MPIVVLFNMYKIKYHNIIYIDVLLCLLVYDFRCVFLCSRITVSKSISHLTLVIFITLDLFVITILATVLDTANVDG